MYAYLESLTDEQRSAATFDGPALRILAGAGTGKTATLSARAAWLIERQGLSPDRLLMLTFTRRAAQEMAYRTAAAVEQTTSAGRTTPLTSGTFHSIANRLLRSHAQRLGISPDFSVIDTGDAADLFDVIRQDLGHPRKDAKRFPKRGALLDFYSSSVNTQTKISSVIASTAPWATDHTAEVAEICATYVKEKKRLGLLDFDDLLLYLRAALVHPSVGPRLCAKFSHVCVDEYQDVNALQVHIVSALVDGGIDITIVGDDCQAIYGFRGASPSHLLDAPEHFDDMATVQLTQNHRSTQAILDAANALADDAPSGFIGRLHSKKPAKSRPRLVTCTDGDAEAYAVVQDILEAREQGVALRDQAILIRAGHHSAATELELTRRNVPFRKYGGLKYLEAAHVKDLIALMRISINPRDELALFRVLQLLQGVGPRRARAAITALELTESDTTTSMLERWGNLVGVLPSDARAQATSIGESIRPNPDVSAPVAASHMKTALAPLLIECYPNADARLRDLDALVGSIAPKESLQTFCSELTMHQPASTGELAGDPHLDEDWVTISTVHSAKGLEWDATYVISAADGNFPADMALSTPEGLEEERRLFYVALTRAKRRLNVYVPLRYWVNPPGGGDRHVYAQKSRFLSDGVTKCFAPRSVGSQTAISDAAGGAAHEIELDLEHLWT